VAISRNVPSFQSVGTIDSWRDLYIRTSGLDAFPYAFGVWQLANASASSPESNPDIGVQLIQEDGTPFTANADFGIDFNDHTGKIVMWDGSDHGTVWETEATLDAAGHVEPVWLVKRRPSTTASQPAGNFVTGVLGKWHFVSELGAYIALDEVNLLSGDAAVWLYKPFGARQATVPVYRFNAGNFHFYTSSTTEASYVGTLPGWRLEGIAFHADASSSSETRPVYRFNTGTHHFYTISENEKNYVLTNMPNYVFEGIEFYASATRSTEMLPVYRFNTGVEHFYTISENEKNYVLANIPTYRYEGIAFYSRVAP
jgi:hypothetical protein